MKQVLKWLAVAGCVVVLASVAGRIHFARAADEGPAYDRATEGDAASRLDRIIDKLDRVVDRMNADRMNTDRMGPPGPPPHRGAGKHADHPGDHQRQRGEPGMRGEGRPGRPRPMADMPPEMREMIEKRMQEGRKRMEQAREKFQELEERVKKLEAEIERLKAA